MRINWQYALIAMALAAFSWYQVSGRERVETWVEVPVEVTAPPKGLVIQQGLVNRVQVRVRGPRGLVRRIGERDLAYTLPLGGLKPGQNVIELNASAIPVSRALQVMEINPQRLMLTVDKLMSKAVPVKPLWTTQPDLHVIGVSADPKEVVLTGPEGLVSDISMAQTELIEFNATRSGLWENDVGLSLPASVEANPPRIRIDATIEVKTKDVWYKVPFRLNAEELKRVARIEPSEVRVNLTVPLPLLRGDDVKNLVYATLLLPEKLQPGAIDVPYDVSLPEGCELIEGKPAKVRVFIKEEQ